MGLAGYYKRFIKSFGIIYRPLFDALKKDAFTWSGQQTQAFQTLKTSMTQAPVLALPDYSSPFVLEADASGYGIGAVLMQEGHPLAFVSKALGSCNQTLSVYEKEFLAVMKAIDEWRPYLQRAPFEILTDHKSLCMLGDQQLVTELHARPCPK